MSMSLRELWLKHQSNTNVHCAGATRGASTSSNPSEIEQYHQSSGGIFTTLGEGLNRVELFADGDFIPHHVV